MMSAEEFARAIGLICRDLDCKNCPLKNKMMSCTNFKIWYPAEVVKRVELWWRENKAFYDAQLKYLDEYKRDNEDSLRKDI